MPLGTGQDKMTNVPGVPFTPNAAMFDQGTAKNHSHAISFATPGPGQTVMRELPKANVLTWITITFEGFVTVTTPTGTVTPTWRWPYGLLQQVNFSANLQNGLINCSGIDLHVMRVLSNPAYIDATDTFPNQLGGGTTLAAGAWYLYLTWQVPVVMDKVTLAGAIYAQSNQNALTLSVTEETTANLATVTGTSTWALTGNWTYNVDSYEIPQDPEHGVITPDLSRLHAIQARETSVTTVGDAIIPTTQVNGQLTRALVQVRPTLAGFVNPKPQSTKDWQNLRMIYGANQTPLDYAIGPLVARNNEHYGAVLPYGYVCLDFVRENAIRDAVYMPGLTDLKIVPTLDSALTVDANGKVRVVQEMLFS